MAIIKPFKAVRPTRDKVSLVASRSYQTYTKAEREARLNYNPFSFLHIVNPGYKYAKEITGKDRHSLVKNRYLEFKEEGIFIKDEKPSFYIYKIVNREQQVFQGILAIANASDYENNCIKKHEETIKNREETFKNYLQNVGFNAEPILLTYPDTPAITNLLKKTLQTRAEFEFTTTYRDTHYLWQITDAATLANIEKEFTKLSTIYIADGHHRLASSYLVYKEAKKNNKNHTGNESYNYFMSFLVPESQIKIYEFNRLVKDLNQLSKEAFLIQLDTMFRIEKRGKIPYKPTKKHHFSMYLDGAFYSLYLRKSNYKITTALDALDTQILYKTILQPILGITNLRNDNRLQYSTGKKDSILLKSNVDSGKFAVGFGMVPVTMEELKNIAKQGFKMPPKSTYIEPKLRSGITIYEY